MSRRCMSPTPLLDIHRHEPGTPSPVAPPSTLWFSEICYCHRPQPRLTSFMTGRADAAPTPRTPYARLDDFLNVGRTGMVFEQTLNSSPSLRRFGGLSICLYDTAKCRRKPTFSTLAERRCSRVRLLTRWNASIVAGLKIEVCHGKVGLNDTRSGAHEHRPHGASISAAIDMWVTQHNPFSVRCRIRTAHGKRRAVEPEADQIVILDTVICPHRHSCLRHL